MAMHHMLVDEKDASIRFRVCLAMNRADVAADAMALQVYGPAGCKVCTAVVDKVAASMSGLAWALQVHAPEVERTVRREKLRRDRGQAALKESAERVQYLLRYAADEVGRLLAAQERMDPRTFAVAVLNAAATPGMNLPVGLLMDGVADNAQAAAVLAQVRGSNGGAL